MEYKGNKSKKLLFGMMLVIVLFPSCAAKRKATRSGPLLIKNSVEILNTDSTDIKSSDLINYVSPSPNKKFLGLFRLKLFYYEQAQVGKDTKFKRWLNKKFGEPPVYADSSRFEKSVEQIEQQLFNLGYFSPTVTYEVSPKKSGNVKVKYLVDTYIPHRYSEVHFNIADDAIKQIAYPDSTSSLIREGDIFNAYTLNNERNRVEKLLRNNGYYYFSKNLIQFNVDTTEDFKAKVFMEMENPIVNVDEKPEEIKLQKYYIRNVDIYPNFDFNYDYDKFKYELNFAQYDSNDTLFNGKYNVYQIGKTKLKHKYIISALDIEPGQEFRIDNVSKSYKGLSTLQIIRYSNISFTPASNNLNDSLLDCRVEMIRRPVHVPSIEAEATNSYGKLGLGLNLVYKNRNIFRGGETFSLKNSGAMELQLVKREENAPVLHTIQFGTGIQLFFPRFLLPFKLGKLPRYMYPQTNIDLGYNYQRRTIYKRHIFNSAIRYSWQQTPTISQVFSPVDINFIKINTSEEFQQMLDAMTNTQYKSQYTDHIIMATRYTFTFNNQKAANIGDFFYLRFQVETAGNVLNGVNRMFNMPKAEEKDYYEILKVRYAQYALFDVDFKYFHYFTPKSSIIARFVGGIGIPYSNSEALPMEKSFFAGGSNDMRGWILKTLGPGSYSSDINLERLGDVMLKFNFEYRFPIHNFIRGAIFADVGNIWLLKEDNNFPGGEFKFNRFYKEFAADIGLGLRFDFNFAVIRLDVGFPVVDPSLPENQRIRPIKDYKFSDIIPMIAVGYPF
ncbi:MAG: BamA/TamA family outer membrane protein [Bacteroidales bacterium]|jgi:outer membrane protein assembly factor BamA